MKIKLGLYKHFKGGIYKVIGIAKHSDTLEDTVIYEAQGEHKLSKLWARPLDDFLGYKEIDGKKIKRFTYIGQVKQ
jgi:hypothetical protein